MSQTKTDSPRKLPFDKTKACAHLSSKDKKMKSLIEKVGPMRLELMHMHDCFETLLESIVYQQLTGKAAATIMTRVKGIFSGEFPNPEQVVEVSDDTLRAAGLSRAKTAAIKDLAQKSLEGRVPEIAQLQKMDDNEIIQALTEIRGIGDWTVQMLLIFRLGRPDVMPATDYGVRKGFALLYKKKDLPAPKEILEYSEIWRPYRSVASWYLWRALEL